MAQRPSERVAQVSFVRIFSRQHGEGKKADLVQETGHAGSNPK